MIHLKANTRRAVALSDDLITSGSAGIEVEILCSDAWEGLTKTVLFRGSGSSVDLVLSGCSCTVPPEVLTVPGGQLLIGLYGSDGSGNLAIPTVWADAGRILQGAEPSGIAPTPAQKSALDQAIEALQTATEEIPSQIDTALAEAKASGEFDGEDGFSPTVRVATDTSTRITTMTVTDASGTRSYTIPNVAIFAVELYEPSGSLFTTMTAKDVWDAVKANMDVVCLMRENNTLPTPQKYTYYVMALEECSYSSDSVSFPAMPDKIVFTNRHDVSTGDRIERLKWTSANPNWVYSLNFAPYDSQVLSMIGSEVSIELEMFSSGTIGDLSDLATEDQSNIVAAINEVAAGQGGGGTSDYSELTNKPSINNVTLSGNKSASDLGLGTYSKPSGGIPKSDLASSVQTSLGKADTALQSFTETDPTVPSWAKASSKPSYTAAEVGAYEKPASGIPASDLSSAVRTSLGKADTALQSYTETDPTVPSWAKASSKPSYTAAEVGAVAANQGSGNAGKFLVVGSDGAVTPVAMSAWQGGSY